MFYPRAAIQLHRPICLVASLFTSATDLEGCKLKPIWPKVDSFLQLVFLVQASEVIREWCILLVLLEEVTGTHGKGIIEWSVLNLVQFESLAKSDRCSSQWQNASLGYEIYLCYFWWLDVQTFWVPIEWYSIWPNPPPPFLTQGWSSLKATFLIHLFLHIMSFKYARPRYWRRSSLTPDWSSLEPTLA